MSNVATCLAGASGSQRQHQDETNRPTAIGARCPKSGRQQEGHDGDATISGARRTGSVQRDTWSAPAARVAGTRQRQSNPPDGRGARDRDEKDPGRLVETRLPTPKTR